MRQAIQTNTIAISIIKVVFGALALWASAEVTIPLKPVPVTLQTLTMMIIGLTYTPMLAVSTISTYLLAGASGLPVFTNFQGGISYMMGPTCGYLVGFWFSCNFMPHFAKVYGMSVLSIFWNCLMGQALIYIPGVLWLSGFIGFEAAIYKGFVVYIPSGLIKMFILIATIRYLGVYKK